MCLVRARRAAVTTPYDCFSARTLLVRHKNARSVFVQAATAASIDDAEIARGNWAGVSAAQSAQLLRVLPRFVDEVREDSLRMVNNAGYYRHKGRYGNRRRREGVEALIQRRPGARGEKPAIAPGDAQKVREFVRRHLNVAGPV